MKWQDLGDTPCSIARTLSVVGDRWTLLILRNAFLRLRRFEEFQQQLGITRHLLADRLLKLVEHGVLEKVAYQQNPPRHEYRLTAKGRDLYPVLMALVAWGDRWMDDGQGAPLLYRHSACGHRFAPVMACSECGAALEARAVQPLAGPGLRRSSDPAARAMIERLGAAPAAGRRTKG